MGAAGDGLGDGLHTDLLVHRPLHLRDPPVGRGQRPGDAGERGGRDWREKGRAPPPRAGAPWSPCGRWEAEGRRWQMGTRGHLAHTHALRHTENPPTQPRTHARRHTQQQQKTRLFLKCTNSPVGGRQTGAGHLDLADDLALEGDLDDAVDVEGYLHRRRLRHHLVLRRRPTGPPPQRGGGRSLGRPRYSPVLRKSGGPQFRIWKGDSG